MVMGDAPTMRFMTIREHATRAAKRRATVSTLGILIEAMVRGGSVLLSALGLAFGVAAAGVFLGLGGILAAACVACLALAITVERATVADPEQARPGDN